MEIGHDIVSNPTRYMLSSYFFAVDKRSRGLNCSVLINLWKTVIEA